MERHASLLGLQIKLTIIRLEWQRIGFFWVLLRKKLFKVFEQAHNEISFRDV